MMLVNNNTGTKPPNSTKGPLDGDEYGYPNPPTELPSEIDNELE